MINQRPLYFAIALFTILLVVVLISGVYKTFEKAGKPGWHAFVPVLNYYTYVKISGNHGGWMFLMAIPYIGFILSAPIHFDFARRFNYGNLFAVAHWLFTPITLAAIGYSDSKYKSAQDGKSGSATPRNGQTKSIGNNTINIVNHLDEDEVTTKRELINELYDENSNKFEGSEQWWNNFAKPLLESNQKVEKLDGTGRRWRIIN